MVAVLLFGAISLTWGILGLVLTLAPTLWMTFVKKILSDPWQRFWLTQGMLLIGLVLMIGTVGLQGFWLWVVCGGIEVVKACFLLGASEACRDQFTTIATTRPIWVYRGSGLLIVLLAVLLTADTIFHA